MAISSTSTENLKHDLLIAVLVFFIAALLYGQFGFKGILMRDNAIYLYSGQQMARGIAPYQSIFDHKGPVSPILVGGAVKLSNIIGTDDIFTVRILFYLLSCLAVGGVFLLGRQCFGSIRAGLFSSFVMLGMSAFGMHASMGPRAKTPMVLFEIFALYFIGKRQWFWAGMSIALAALTWQPAGVFAIVGLLFLWRWSETENRKRNMVLYGLGIALPFIITSSYFFLKGAFGDFMQGYFLFNFIYLSRESVTLVDHFRIIYSSIISGYYPMGLAVFLGLLTMLTLFAARIREMVRFVFSGNDDKRNRDLLMPVLWAFPFPVLFMMMDFQGPVDLFILLPYVCLGAGLLLDTILRHISRMEGMDRKIMRLLSFGVCVFLIVLAGINYRMISNSGLSEQIDAARKIEDYLPENVQVVSMGVPEFFALTHRHSPTPYLFIMNGIDNYIEANYPGGLQGWLSSIGESKDVYLAYGGVSGPHAEEIERWLRLNFESVYMEGFLCEFMKRRKRD